MPLVKRRGHGSETGATFDRSIRRLVGRVDGDPVDVEDDDPKGGDDVELTLATE